MSSGDGIIIVRVEYILDYWGLLLNTIEDYIENMLTNPSLSMNELLHWREIDITVKTLKRKNKPTTGLEAAILLKSISKENDTPYCIGYYIIFSNREYMSAYYFYDEIINIFPNEYIRI